MTCETELHDDALSFSESHKYVTAAEDVMSYSMLKSSVTSHHPAAGYVAAGSAISHLAAVI